MKRLAGGRFFQKEKERKMEERKRKELLFAISGNGGGSSGLQSGFKPIAKKKPTTLRLELFRAGETPG